MGKHKKDKVSKKNKKKERKPKKHQSSETDSSSPEELNKHKRKHKSKETSSKSRKRYSSDSDSSSSTEYVEKKRKHKSKSKEYSSDSQSSGSEWIEKPTVKEEPKRDDWFSLSTNFMLTGNDEKKKSREENRRIAQEKSAYNPSTCSRELNPYWKNGGDGLPTFKKPSDDSDVYRNNSTSRPSSSKSNWRKKTVDERKDRINQIPTEIVKDVVKVDTVNMEDDEVVLSKKELNSLAAKLVKAEIMGNDKLIKELKDKLERARNNSGSSTSVSVENVVLTRTDSKGFTKPVTLHSEDGDSSKKKKRRMETHSDGNRVRYFADDDKFSLKEMFENEKFNSVEEQNSQFLSMAGKVRKNEDMDDIFTDNIRQKESSSKVDKRNTDRAITEHKRVADSLDNCNKCLQSGNMLKHLLVTMSENIYISLPSYEPLTEGHCFLIPIKHTSCSTQLDENEWSELLNYKKLLTAAFRAKSYDVVFIETAIFLNRHPHMKVECIPIEKEVGELAPIYFKKAIDESEKEWSINKQLVSLRGRDVRRAIPKGLPYFTVSFGLDEGYAHVIEDEQDFPSNFGQEIIGGMLDLHHSKWRKPKRQSFEEQSKRVVAFSKEWASFDNV